MKPNLVRPYPPSLDTRRNIFKVARFRVLYGLNLNALMALYRLVLFSITSYVMKMSALMNMCLLMMEGLIASQEA